MKNNCNKTHVVKKLAIGGGGMRGFCYLGTVSALIDKEIIHLDNINEYIGTSIGSIISVMLSIGYEPKELYSKMIDYDMNKLQNINIEILTKFYGIDNGNNIINFMKELIKKKIDNSEITLKELYHLTQKKVTLVTTCLTTRETVYLNYETFPDLKVYHAIRLSISIPLLFSCPEFKGKRYTDGSVSMDYPIKYYHDTYGHTNDVIGMIMTKVNLYEQDKHDIETIEDFVKSVFNCFMKKINKLEIGNYKDRTIVIDTGDFSSIDFNIGLSNKEKLFNIGYDSLNICSTIDSICLSDMLLSTSPSPSASALPSTLSSSSTLPSVITSPSDTCPSEVLLDTELED